MDVTLLQQILNGLQQNNADLTAMVNSQTYQFNQQMATLQVSQLASTTNWERGKIARPEPFDGSAEKIDIFLRELYLNFEDEALYFQTCEKSVFLYPIWRWSLQLSGQVVLQGN